MNNKVKIIATPILILIYWQLVSSSGLVSSYLLPPPYMVATAAQNMLENGVLTNHILTSLERVFQGFLISCFLAFSVALLTHWSSTLEQLVSAPLALLRMIPALAMTPLLILWLGIGNATQLSIIVLASVFPIYLNIRDGLQRVRPEYRELASSLGLSPVRFFTFIMISSAVPSIVTGVRLGFGYSWRALIGAELIAASAGLGFLIIDSQEMMRTDDVMVGILTIGLIGWSLDTLFYRVVCARIAHRFPEVTK